MIDLNIKTPSAFAEEIEQMVKDLSISHFDAIVHYCDRNEIEIETVASWVKGSQVLKSKVMLNAQDLNMIKKSARLPI
mgnify:CR=1 FL=1|tara:strand:+ start:6310 stop:6543 length:234 start_codon:yes stop_codon:yes gene_type:complete